MLDAGTTCTGKEFYYLTTTIFPSLHHMGMDDLIVFCDREARPNHGVTRLAVLLEPAWELRKAADPY